jgi:hypothetical protein
MCFRPGVLSVRSSLGLVVTLLGAAGCTPVPDRAKHTVSDYRADAELRRIELAKCWNDPGTLGKSPDCVNARDADRAEGMGSLRELPPLELPKTGSPPQGKDQRPQE